MEQRLNEPRTLRIGTRGSDLALWQAHQVQERLGGKNELVIIKTEGDLRLDIALQGGTTTGFFTKDIERRLVEGEIDVAVHSLKDLPTAIDERLEVAAYLPRGPVQDLLLVHPDFLDEEGLLPLKAGCRVGAGSLRRQALVRLYRPEASPELIRGNVPTRVRKCVEGQYGAVVLARAGVYRLGLDLSPLQVFELDLRYWLPAPGQGAVAVQVRRDDGEALAAVRAINDEDTAVAVNLERRLLSNFEGGCHTAFGAFARRADGAWHVDIGIDRGEAGWGQLVLEGTADRCAAAGPARIPDFRAADGLTREALCRRIDWSF